MCRCHAITGKSQSLDLCKAEKTSCLNKPLMFYRSQLISTPLGGSRCVQDEHCGDIWPKSMPCTGDPIRGRKARMYNGHIHRSFSDICLIRSCFMFMYLSFFRLLVSASQDGKLIIWDSYTTNKAGFVFVFFM